MPKKVLLTGSTGFLGTHLLRRLVREGHHVVVLVRPKDGVTPQERTQALVSAELADRVTLIEGDLLEDGAGVEESIIRRHVDTVDLLVHAAAIVKFEDRYSEQHLQVNVNGTRRAMELAGRLAVPVAYHVSTAYTTGTSPEAFERLHPAGTTFYNGYERSKELTEQYVAGLTPRKMKVAVFRPSIIVGDSRTGEADTDLALYGFMHCVQRFLGSLTTADMRSTFRLLADPDTRLNFVSVDVVCEALLSAMHQGVHDGFFHITDPLGVSVRSVLASLCASLGARTDLIIAAPHLEPDELSARELRLNRLVSAFLPYLNNGPRFHRSNTDRLFRRAGITCPVVDDEVLAFLMRTYAARFARRVGAGTGRGEVARVSRGNLASMTAAALL